MKKLTVRTTGVAAGIVVFLLAVTLIGAITTFMVEIEAKENALIARDFTINNLDSQVTSKDSLIASKDAKLAVQNQTIVTLNSELSNQVAETKQLEKEKERLQTWLSGNITSLTANITSLQTQVTASNAEVADLQRQASIDNATIVNLQGQLESTNSQVNSLTAEVSDLQDQVNSLKAILSTNQSALQTLAFHVSEKGDDYTWGHLPDVNGTYNQILGLTNDAYDVLLLPEYEGHANWTEELAWLTSNFGGPQGIPIMLDVFGGGEEDAPIPMLSLADIEAAIEACNVKYLRFSEVVSWHIEHSQPFPADYAISVLEFCRANGLRLVWTEWKDDFLPSVETFKAIESYIGGYEDVVTVTFSTNSGDLEPVDGFTKLNALFQHWGASVQSWYWTTRYDTEPQEMPISLLMQHALAAKNMGAEIIQFEPYWYFFDNGQANENLKLLEVVMA